MRKTVCLLALCILLAQAGCVGSAAWKIAHLNGTVERDSSGTVVGVDLSRGIYVPTLGMAGQWTLVGDPLMRSGTVEDSCLAAIRDFENLASLRLTGTSVTGDSLRNLRHPEKLRSLGLTATRVSDEDLRLVGALENLTELSLSGTAISDEGLRHLAALENLEVLSLDNTVITDDGLATLLKLKSLRTIHARDTRISPSAIQEAKRTRPQLRIVVERPLGGVI